MDWPIFDIPVHVTAKLVRINTVPLEVHNNPVIFILIDCFVRCNSRTIFLLKRMTHSLSLSWLNPEPSQTGYNREDKDSSVRTMAQPKLNEAKDLNDWETRNDSNLSVL
jgi:uncharacterized protein with von Willebrand factor type A (vWA) domain